MTKTRVLIAETLPIFRSGVRSLLEQEGGLDVSVAANLREVLALAAERPPHLALVDADLPPRGGVAAVAELTSRYPCIVAVWSFEPTCENVLAAVRAGAAGFLEKQIGPEGILRALRAAMRGEAPLSRSVSTLMVAALHEVEQQGRARERTAELSRRERQVLALLAKGEPNKEIAGELLISEFTVKRHVQNILRKLDVNSRRAAAAFYHSASGGVA